MTPQTRKAIVLLGRIEKGAPTSVYERQGSHSDANAKNLRFEDVSADDNSVRLRRDGGFRIYPLDLIRSVYRDEHGWHIVMHAFR